jgi:hypothetical protein
VRSTCTGYSDGPFDQDAVSIGRTFAHYAAVARPRRAVQQYLGAGAAAAAGVAIPAVIDQAKGIIMAELRCNPDERHVSGDPVPGPEPKVRDIAAEIVHRTQQP